MVGFSPLLLTTALVVLLLLCLSALVCCCMAWRDVRFTLTHLAIQWRILPHSADFVGSKNAAPAIRANRDHGWWNHSRATPNRHYEYGTLPAGRGGMHRGGWSEAYLRAAETRSPAEPAARPGSWAHIETFLTAGEARTRML